MLAAVGYAWQQHISGYKVQYWQPQLMAVRGCQRKRSKQRRLMHSVGWHASASRLHPRSIKLLASPCCDGLLFVCSCVWARACAPALQQYRIAVQSACSPTLQNAELPRTVCVGHMVDWTPQQIVAHGMLHQ